MPILIDFAIKLENWLHYALVFLEKMTSQSILIILVITGNIVTYKTNSTLSEDWLNSEEVENMGPYFPVKYLVPDETIPTLNGLDYYLSSMMRTVSYFHRRPNSTDCNTAMGLFVMKCVLKKTIIDETIKIKKYHIDILKKVIYIAEYVISHYVYNNNEYGWTDPEFRASRLFTYDEPFIYSIGNFNRNRLKKMILTEKHINDFVEDMDKATFPKEKYAALVDDMSSYNINIEDSDTCMTRIAYNRDPIKLTKTHPCKPDEFCRYHIYASPSVAYTLSHRLLNMLSLRYFRRCHVVSEEDDAILMDELCSFMYREAVYLARRGYFARDIFMEHVALCGLLGYEEFFRHHWFQKVASWISDEGCIQEFLNFEINRTIALRERTKSTPIEKKYNKFISQYLKITCHKHPMAVSLPVLAHAIRHAVHYTHN